MLDIILPQPKQRISALWQTQRANLLWWLWIGGVIGFSLIFGLYMLVGAPDPVFIAWFIFYIGLATAIARPRYGIYLIVFFTLAGDGLLMFQYPFVKNFSSPESLLYLNDLAIISPAEVYMLATLVAWFGRIAFQRRVRIYRSPLLVPTLLFIAFVTYGMAYGLSRGGNVTIALWEARPIFYLLLMIFLVNNLMTERQHLINLLWFAMAAIFLESLAGVNLFINELNFNFRSVDRITEHSAAIHMNTLFVFIALSWLYKMSPARRAALLAMAPTVLITYLVTQRRAAFVSLAAALLLTMLFLYRERRDFFWLITPPLVIFGLAYVAAFWNSNSIVALPAQAVKSVVAASRASSIDRASNLYRQIENVNASVTIHTATFSGVGFGNKFIIRVPMPDISFFGWWEYITHNSIIWVWMKTGVFGFVAMLFFVGTSIMTAARAAWRMPGGELSAVVLTSTLYIVMHFIYAYVDMSWDNQSMIYLGALIGLTSSAEYIVRQPVKIRPKRWSWQPDPQPPPGLRP